MASLDGARRHERFGLAHPARRALACLPCLRAMPSLGTFAEGTTLGEEGLRIAEAVAHPGSLMCAYLRDRSAVPSPRRPAQGTPCARTGLGICQDTRQSPLAFPPIAACRVQAYALWADASRERRAAACTRAMQAQTPRCNWTRSALPMLWLLGEAHLLAGRLEEAHALAEQALALARQHQERGAPGVCPAPPRRDCGAAPAPGERSGRSPLPPGPRPGRGTRHAPARGPLPPRPREALCQDRTPRRGPHRLSAAIELYRAMEMTFWLPQAEAATGAGGEVMTLYDRSTESVYPNGRGRQRGDQTRMDIQPIIEQVRRGRIIWRQHAIQRSIERADQG